MVQLDELSCSGRRWDVLTYPSRPSLPFLTGKLLDCFFQFLKSHFFPQVLLFVQTHHHWVLLRRITSPLYVSVLSLVLA